MSEDIEVYRPQSSDLTINRAATDDWYESFPNIIKLAEYVADTEFVPDAMRRHPAAIAAAILTGREMNLPPMVSLRHLFVVRGRVGQSAELMRAQIYRAGHEIRFIESTDQRCVVEGRRSTESEWTRVQFTTEDAKRAGIDLRGYASDKLVARATSRLARRKFPDAVMGLPTVDELEDNAPPAEVVELAPGPPVKRQRATRRPQAASTQPKPAERPQAPDDDTEELLDDIKPATPPPEPEPPKKRGRPKKQPPPEPNPRLEEARARADEAHKIIFEQPEPAPASMADLAPTPPPEQATPAQNRLMHALFNQLGITNRDDRLIVSSEILGFPINTSTGLDKNEASRLIDTLDRWQQEGTAEQEITNALNQWATRQTDETPQDEE